MCERRLRLLGRLKLPKPKTLCRSLRMIGHMGTETRPQRFDGCSVESWALEETLTQPCREGDHSCKWFKAVKLCHFSR